MEEWLFNITVDLGHRTMMISEAPKKIALEWLFYQVTRASVEMGDARMTIRMSVLRKEKK